jgi:hypothetical protein
MAAIDIDRAVRVLRDQERRKALAWWRRLLRLLQH